MKKYITLLLATLFAITCYSQSWVQLNDTPFKKRGGVAFSHNGKGYLLGGRETFTGNSTLWEYNPVDDQWTQLPNGPFDLRTSVMGDYYQGKLYFGFGVEGDSFDQLRDLWVLDLSDMSYEYLGDIPRPGIEAGPFKVHEDKIFIGVGFGQEQADWWMYDISTNVWEQKTDVPVSDIHESMEFVFGDYVYVFGSHFATNWYKYHIPTDTWTTVDDMPGARHGSAFSAYNGKAYIISGDRDDHQIIDSSRIFMEYDPFMDSWNTIPEFPKEGFRFSARSFVINGKLYFFGGDDEDLQNETDHSMYVFDLDSLNNNPTNVETTVLEEKLEIVPNPILDNILLDGINFSSDNFTVFIFNQTGQQIYSGKLKSDLLNVQSLIKGSYIIKIISNKQHYTGVFIKM